MARPKLLHLGTDAPEPEPPATPRPIADHEQARCEECGEDAPFGYRPGGWHAPGHWFCRDHRHLGEAILATKPRRRRIITLD